MLEINESKSEMISESTCRLCLLDSEGSQLIFESDLNTWIEDLTSLKIVKYPSAPASLCLNCKIVLEKFEKFRKLCFLNDEILQQLFVHTDQKEKVCNLQDISNEDLKLNLQNERNPGIPIKDPTFKIELGEYSMAIGHDRVHDKEAVAQNDIKRNKTRGYKPQLKSCPVCNISVSALGEHLIKVHKDYQPFQCEYCSRRFNLHGNLIKHIRRHRQEKTHICPHCGKGFNNTGELKVHIRVHTNEQPYACSECGKTFKTSGMLCRHMQSHQNRRPHECEICQARFYTTGHLKRHRTKHTLERPFGCEICGKKFTRPEATRVQAHKCIKSLE